MQAKAVIIGSGHYVPEPTITNDELCDAFNAYVTQTNTSNKAAIDAGTMIALRESSSEFITKASGIQERHVIAKEGILDPQRMQPLIPMRQDDEISVQCEFALQSAQKALAAANCDAKDIDLVIVSASNLQRLYPGIAVEVQKALGTRGFAYDMTVGCSSSTFAIQVATDAIVSGSATRALIVNPEIMSPQINWRDRDSHFIFGDASTALILETAQRTNKPKSWNILGTKLYSNFSSTVRNNSGYMNRCDPQDISEDDKLFYQQGRKVFKDICPLIPVFIQEHLEELKVPLSDIKRFWLHQANSNINLHIFKRMKGREPIPGEMPMILNEYGNTSSAGSLISFDKYHEDLPSGALGILCSFGAGYSAGNVLLQRQ